MAIRATPERIVVVGSAAAPVGGDELDLAFVVGAGARLTVGTAAATIVWPGPSGRRSVQRTDAVVGERGVLHWEPEPVVAVAGCRHSTTTRVELAATASAWIVEEVSLGRSGEEPGRIDVEWHVSRDGKSLLRHRQELGPDVPGWGSITAAASYRHLLTALAVGAMCATADAGDAGEAPTRVERDGAGARLAVADDVVVVLAAGATRTSARRIASSLIGYPSSQISSSTITR